MVVLQSLARSFQKKFSQTSREGIKEGHFSVMATHEGDSKRFVVPMSCLSNPSFVRLLDEAEEEYGFHQQSILTVPCHPSDLERVLAGEMKKQRRVSSGLMPRASW